jgi:hypothetical protein
MSRALFLAGCFALGACAPDPVTWDAEARLSKSPPAGARMLLRDRDVPGFTAAWTPPVMPPGAPQCAGSLVATPARGDTAYAAWWAPRADSSALLVVARSADGGRSWRAPEVADSTDHGRTGCSRLAPFIAADSTNGYVHVVYFMVAAEGPGIFFTHSMERGEQFHSPVPIVYGDRAVPSAVACDGDTVAVGFIDPNSATPQLWLALSRTTGHIFESRMEVSPSTVQAARPAVAIRGHRVAVAWLETNRSGGAAVMVVKSGRWQ